MFCHFSAPGRHIRSALPLSFSREGVGQLITSEISAGGGPVLELGPETGAFTQRSSSGAIRTRVGARRMYDAVCPDSLSTVLIRQHPLHHFVMTLSVTSALAGTKEELVQTGRNGCGHDVISREFPTASFSDFVCLGIFCFHWQILKTVNASWLRRSFISQLAVHSLRHFNAQR